MSSNCYNRGCGKTFDPDNNPSDACTFHPGEPFFHDAYKGWSCCNKKCTDFTEFLNIKGCTRSSHNPNKPAEVAKPVVDKSKRDEVIEYRAPVPKAPVLQRPDVNAPVTTLNVTVTPSLRQALEKLSISVTEEARKDNSDVVTVGTTCKNHGCKKSYENEASNSEICVYHSGVPIFHEGLKFWSCCQKRTTDFEVFLNQVGCTEGSHVWIKKESDQKKVSCRYDYHETGTHVFVTVYAKNSDPEKSTFSLNPVKLVVNATFPDGVFEDEFILKGVVDVSNSSVTMAATKVEIKLKKAEAMSWGDLTIPKPRIPKKTTSDDNQPAQPLTTEDYRVDIDLDDIDKKPQFGQSNAAPFPQPNEDLFDENDEDEDDDDDFDYAAGPNC